MKVQLSYNYTRLLLNGVFFAVIAVAAWRNSLSYPYGHIAWWHLAIYNILLLLPAVLHNFVLLPFLRKSRNMLLYGLYLLPVILVPVVILSGYLNRLLACYPGSTPFHYTGVSLQLQLPAALSGWSDYLQALPGVLLILILMALAAAVWRVMTSRRSRLRAEREQAVAELNLLKYQVSPHFLFNVLNSLYALALKRSEQTPGVILQLADILRYSLYRSGEREVPLRDEITVLESYIAVERLRIPETAAVIFDHGAADTTVTLAPMLLLPVLENAFKHGIGSMTGAAYIRAGIRTEGRRLYFTCDNNYLPKPPAEGGGIGLPNIAKRLALLYPGQHTLDIRRGEGVFRVIITINL